MSRYAAKRMQTKNVAFAFVVALIASLLIWTPSWQNPWAVASGDLGYDSEVDFYTNVSADGYWRIEDTSPIALATGFTVETWYYPTTLSGQQGWVSQGALSSTTNRFTIGNNGTELRIFANKYVDTGFLLETGRWYHVAVARQSDNDLLVYVNGALVWTDVISLGSSASSADFYVGKHHYSAGSEFAAGRVDQVKVWSSALSAADIQKSMHISETSPEISGTLTNVWSFNEGSGITVYDRVGSSDLSINGTSSFADVKSVATADDGDIVVSFPRTYLPGVGGWTVPDGISSLEYLIVAGGGAGAYAEGGGGGAGGLIQGQVAISSGTHSVIVGQGGVATTSRVTANNGQSSTFSPVGTAIGGGGGGANFYGDSAAGASGGSGGGGGGWGTGRTEPIPGGTGTSNQGFDGGA